MTTGMPRGRFAHLGRASNLDRDRVPPPWLIPCSLRQLDIGTHLGESLASDGPGKPTGNEREEREWISTQAASTVTALAKW